MNSPVRHIDPVAIEQSLYTDVMRLPQFVRGPEGGPDYVHGPPTLEEAEQAERAEQCLFERAAQADQRGVERAVFTVLEARRQRGATGSLTTEELQSVVHAMWRMAMSVLTTRVASLRGLRTKWTRIMWLQSARPAACTRNLEKELDMLSGSLGVAPVRVLRRGSRRKRSVIKI